jgi:MFS family permease
MFIVTALQYWATQYMVTVLKGDKEVVYITFSVTVFTAPPTGAIVGGIITSRFLGSYTNRRALSLCFLVYILFVACCIPCPIMNTSTGFIILMWLAIFMQGFIQPIMTGIILNTVTPIERPTASAFSHLFEKLLGMLPAPYVYGLVYENTEKIDPTTGKNVSHGGMYAIFFSSAVGIVFLFFALVLRNRSYKKAQEGVKNSLLKTNPQIAIEEVQ